MLLGVPRVVFVEPILSSKSSIHIGIYWSALNLDFGHRHSSWKLRCHVVIIFSCQLDPYCPLVTFIEELHNVSWQIPQSSITYVENRNFTDLQQSVESTAVRDCKNPNAIRKTQM